MKRKVMTIDQIRDEQRDCFAAMGDDVDRLGVMALVDVENMGWCKDGTTRYYFFTNEAGEPSVYFKH